MECLQCSLSPLRKNRRCLVYAVLICVLMTTYMFLFAHITHIKWNSEESPTVSIALPEAIPKQLTQVDKVKPKAPLEPTAPLEKKPKEPVKFTLSADDIIYEKLQNDLENLPVAFLRKYQNYKMYYKNATCARLTNLFGIEFSNIYWQSMSDEESVFQFLGAYYDNRTLNKLAPSVRIISMINQLEPKDNFCQFWFNGSTEPIITKVAEYKYIWHKVWGTGKLGSYQPFLITCQLPPQHKEVPAAVSIVNRECQNASNLLKVINDKPDQKQNFAVCVKGLDFMDIDMSLRLIEWVELLTILGADMIYLYKLQIHPNIEKVLNYYEGTGQVRVVPFTLPGTQPNHPLLQHMYLQQNIMKKRHNEILTYNDCFYRNINAYKYVVVLDIDEVIMPIGDISSWQELLEIVQNEIAKTGKKHASFFARNVYFMDNHMHNHEWFPGIPNHLHMLQHVYRSKNFTKPRDYVKTFFDTERSLLLHNHLPIACLEGSCSFPIAIEHAQLQHYREGCERSVKKAVCEDFKNNSVIDTSIWKFKEKVILKTNNTIRALGIVTNDNRTHDSGLS